MSQPRGARRRGFTLVELMVVIAIMAVLGMLVVPAVINARKTARSGAIKTEIEMLNMQLNNYKSEYGSFPPCFGAPAAGSPTARHLQRLFPRCTTVVNELGSGTMTPQIAINSWLKGYTTDPTLPITGASGRRQFFDFDNSRVMSGTYAPIDEPDSPYVYIDAANYGSVTNPTSYPVVTTSGTTFYTAQTRVIGTGTSFFNPDTFQILCAGQDNIWNTDDDLSNFWRRTRGDFKTSGQ